MMCLKIAGSNNSSIHAFAWASESEYDAPISYPHLDEERFAKERDKKATHKNADIILLNPDTRMLMIH